jgi:hypothetical protein
MKSGYDRIGSTVSLTHAKRTSKQPQGISVWEGKDGRKAGPRKRVA